MKQQEVFPFVSFPLFYLCILSVIFATCFIPNRSYNLPLKTRFFEKLEYQPYRSGKSRNFKGCSHSITYILLLNIPVMCVKDYKWLPENQGAETKLAYSFL